MRNARLFVRCVALTLVTFSSWVALLVGMPFAALAGATDAWRRTMTSTWSTMLCWVFGARIRVEGRVPDGGYLLVTNHLSYLDIPLLASQARCSFVSKDDVASWPVLGHLSRVAGTVFVDRRRRKDVVRVGEEIRAKLDRGSRLVLFPEGTSTCGAEVGPFKSSLLEPAASAQLPVRYATIRYETPPDEVPARLSVAWWGDMTLAPHVKSLLKMPGFEATVVFGDEPIQDTDRKALAARLHAAVASNFLPMLPAERTLSDSNACLSSRTSPASS